ncbi:hypothetical protein GCM10027425_33670 [Alteromonas gracilis]
MNTPTQICMAIPAGETLFTTEVEHPFKVRLEGFESGDDVVVVREMLRIGDRCIVRSLSGEGFWHIAADAVCSGSIPTAVFQQHTSVRFAWSSRL